MLFYVYEHWRLDRDECFYVGKGHGGRAYKRSGRNSHWTNIVAKLERIGSGYEIRLVATNLSEEEAFAIERERIAFWRDIVDLANMSSGGEGLADPSEEIRQKISAAHTGKLVSDETRAKLSKIHKGKKLTEEQKEMAGSSMRGKKHSSETKAKMSHSSIGKNKGKVRTEEQKQHLRELNTGEKNAFFGKKHSEETRAKMRATKAANKAAKKESNQCL